MSEEVIGGAIEGTRKVEIGGIPFLKGDLLDQGGTTVTVTDVPRNAPKFPKSIYLLVVVTDPNSVLKGQAFVYRAGVRAQQAMNSALTGNAETLDPSAFPGLQLRLTRQPQTVEGKPVVGINPAPLDKVEVTTEMKTKTDAILAGPPE